LSNEFGTTDRRGQVKMRNPPLSDKLQFVDFEDGDKLKLIG